MKSRFFVSVVPMLMLSLPAAVGLTGCDPAADTAADAAPALSPEQAAEEKMRAETRARLEAEKKAEEDAAAKLAADIDALTVLPEELPKKLEQACDLRNEAEDKFMTTHFSGPAVEKWNGAKTMQLGMRKKDCMTLPIEVAACEANALTNAPVELKGELPSFLRVCRDKFNKPAEGGGEGDEAKPG